MELVEEVKELLRETEKVLKGSARRVFMARTVRALGEGGQRLAERELGWNRGTIRKGLHELVQGIICLDAYAARGRKRSEQHLSNLLSDITAIVDGQSQADPQFRTNRLYTRLTATEVRRQLIAQKGYSDAELPILAADHDFQPKTTVTPVGLFLPAFDEVFFYGVTSKVTSDCLVDCLIDWWEATRERFSHITTLVINLDSGPENHSRRTQFMQRLVEFVQQYHMDIRLAYYPPYHSKYNPIERCWGILEQHWNGSLLDSVDAVISYARTMTWKGKHPVVELVTSIYQTGVKLNKEAMDAIETQL